MKKALLASVAAFALVLGTAGGAWASHNDVGVESTGSISVGNVGVNDTVDAVSGIAAVSINALQQVTANTAGAGHDELIADDAFHHGMDFGTNTNGAQL